jgi:DeoR family fructose operon transcriptional repressor
VHQVAKLQQSHDTLLSFDRRKRIVEIVNRKKSVTVDALVDAFPVSRMTVSRDLERLEAEGLLRRVRGGAVSLSHIVVAPPMSRSARALTEEQKCIGREAARRVSNGDFLILESGSTCLALAENLAEKDNLKIATASPMIAMRLAEIVEQYGRRFEIMLAGGILNAYKNFVMGPTAVEMFERLKVDFAFSSVTAIDAEAGITADEVTESAVSRVVLEQCGKKTIGLVASSKFNKASFYKVADVNAFDEIITDRGLDRQTRKLFEEKGVRICVCGQELRTVRSAER